MTPTPTVEDDLALALTYLDRWCPRSPCLHVTTTSPATRSVNLGAPEALPDGSCISHGHYTADPCPIGAYQDLLHRRGIR